MPAAGSPWKIHRKTALRASTANGEGYIGAHARDELGISEIRTACPLQGCTGVGCDGGVLARSGALIVAAVAFAGWHELHGSPYPDWITRSNGRRTAARGAQSQESQRGSGRAKWLLARLVSVAKRSLSFKIAGFSWFFLKRFLDMSVCLWAHV